MVLFWLIVISISAAAVFLVAWPLLFAGRGAVGEQHPNDREARLEAANRDRDYGLIDDEGVAAIEREARRSLVVEAPVSRVSRFGRLSVFAALGLAPLVAILLYLKIGAPGVIVAAQSPNSNSASVGSMNGEAAIAALEARTKAAPDDFTAWMELGGAYVSSGRAALAVEAFARAKSLDAESTVALASFAEALVFEANGAVTKEALDAFTQLLAIEPGEPRARFYIAMARYQVGAVEDAVKGWASLLNDAPADAPWFGAVSARLTEAADEAGIALESMGLSAGARQRLAQGASTSSAAPTFNEALARVDDGSASFDDWMIVAATFAEQGEKIRAREILDQAEARFERAPFLFGRIKEARRRLDAGESLAPSPAVNGPASEQVEAIAAMPEAERRQMIESMVASLAERQKTAPDNLEGWRMLGRSYRVLGRPEESLAAWRELFGRTDPEADDLRQFALALMDLRPEGDNTVGGEMEDALLRLRKLNPDDPFALYHLGFAARDRGDKAAALAFWRRLQELLPPDTPLAPTLSRLINEVDD